MAKFIRSRANELYKTLVKLNGSTRERKRHKKTLIDGVRLIEAYCHHVGAPEMILLSSDATHTPEVQRLLAEVRSPEPVILEATLFKDISPVATPTGVIAVIPIPRPSSAPLDTDSCVLLENIQDPGNVGSILRTAAASGIRHAILSRKSADAWAPRVLRGAMGAHFVLSIEENANLCDFARRYQGQVVATDASARRSVYGVDLRRPTAFALGNEGAGLSAELKSAAHVVAAIPMPGGMESLSVAAAAAVCFFERVRQQQRDSAGSDTVAQ
jgi:TrmH family RNA methyltransferase